MKKSITFLLTALSILFAISSCLPDNSGSDSSNGSVITSTKDTNETNSEDMSSKQEHEVKWIHELPYTDSGQVGVISPLALDENNNVYAVVKSFGGKPYLYSVSPEGEMRFKVENMIEGFFSGCTYPVVSTASKSVYLICGENYDNKQNVYLFCFDYNGKMKWKKDFNSLGYNNFLLKKVALSFVKNPTVVDSFYVVGDFNGEKSLFLVFGQDGNLKKEKSVDFIVNSIAIGKDYRIFAVTKSGALKNFDSNLNEMWEFTGLGGQTEGGDHIVVGNNYYYSLKNPAKLVAVKLGTAGPILLWTFDLTYLRGDPVFDREEKILFVPDKYIYALDTQNGAVKWNSQVTTYGGITLLDDNNTLIGQIEYALSFYAFDGTEKWSGQPYNNNSPAVGTDGTVFSAGQHKEQSDVYDSIFALHGALPLNSSGWAKSYCDNQNTSWFRK